MPNVALMTCSAHPDGIAEDRALVEALARRGMRAASVVWGHAVPDASMIVLRGVWDYVDRIDEFRSWIRSAGPRLWNPVAIVEWNHHKRYLQDLADRGCRVVPTTLLAKGESSVVTGVVKPAVGASARGARRVTRERVVAQEDLIVQPFLPGIERQGELSLVYFAGEYSHAVRKRPAAGDWRVQARYGGTVERCEPTGEERATASLALAGIESLYARVDLVGDLQGEPALMELELIEPELFLLESDGGADRFAAAIEARLPPCP